MDAFVGNIDGVPDYEKREYRRKKFKVALLIPVLNEGDRILAQLRKIEVNAPKVDVIIADGGSRDGLRETIEEEGLGVQVLLTKVGKGKLSAQLRMGFHYCLEKGYDSVITMDGNNKDHPNGINNILEALESGYDFVQGSRFVPGGEAVNTPKLRETAIKTFHAPLTSLAAGKKFTDTTNGFRGFSRAVLLDRRIEIFREVFDTYELIFYLPVRISRIGMRVCEVPVARRYPANEPIPTKIHGFRSYVMLVRILLNAAGGRYSPR